VGRAGSWGRGLAGGAAALGALALVLALAQPASTLPAPAGRATSDHLLDPQEEPCPKGNGTDGDGCAARDGVAGDAGPGREGKAAVPGRRPVDAVAIATAVGILAALALAVGLSVNRRE